VCFRDALTVFSKVMICSWSVWRTIMYPENWTGD
jgi:hypothetical protein